MRGTTGTRTRRADRASALRLAVWIRWSVTSDAEEMVLARPPRSTTTYRRPVPYVRLATRGAMANGVGRPARATRNAVGTLGPLRRRAEHRSDDNDETAPEPTKARQVQGFRAVGDGAVTATVGG